MTASSLRHLLPLAAGSLCLCLASCKSSSKPGYSGVVDYTTPNTNLSQDEYPFDEKGNYLVDVVSGKKKGSKNKKTEVATTSYVDTYEKPPEAAAPTIAAASTNYETPPTTSSDPYASVYSSEGIGSGSTASSKPKTSSSSSGSSSSSKSKTTASKPKPKPTVAKAKPKPKAKPQPSSISYTVKKGDTLYGLANRYGTSVAAIKKASGLSSDSLRDGRTLKIPRK